MDIVIALPIRIVHAHPNPGCCTLTRRYIRNKIIRLKFAKASATIDTERLDHIDEFAEALALNEIRLR